MENSDLESLAYAIYLDSGKKYSRVFEEWRILWRSKVKSGEVQIPEGAWE